MKKYSYGFFSSKNWLEKADKERKYKLAFCFVPTQCVIENSKQIAKKGRERRKRKIIVPFRSYPTRNRNSKNIEKKFQKFKNTIVASFQAIIGWNRPRNRENKNYDSASFQPDA